MDILLEGLQTTVIGMGIVFFVLIVLSLVVSSFQFFNKFSSRFANATDTNDVLDTTTVIQENCSDDLELVAVISAAIAASLNTDVSTVKIRSIRKINNNSKWLSQTRSEQQIGL